MPGDRRLTLATLALSMLSPEAVRAQEEAAPVALTKLRLLSPFIAGAFPPDITRRSVAGDGCVPSPVLWFGGAARLQVAGAVGLLARYLRIHSEHPTMSASPEPLDLIVWNRLARSTGVFLRSAEAGASACREGMGVSTALRTAVWHRC